MKFTRRIASKNADKATERIRVTHICMDDENKDNRVMGGVTQYNRNYQIISWRTNKDDRNEVEWKRIHLT